MEELLCVDRNDRLSQTAESMIITREDLVAVKRDVHAAVSALNLAIDKAAELRVVGRIKVDDRYSQPFTKIKVVLALPMDSSYFDDDGGEGP